MGLRDSRPVRASHIRIELVERHEALDRLIGEVETLARELAGGDSSHRGRLVELSHHLARELQEHLRLEEVALAPLLTELDRAGEGRARGVIFQHKELAERLTRALGDEAGAAPRDLGEELSSIARGLRDNLGREQAKLKDPLFGG